MSSGFGWRVGRVIVDTTTGEAAITKTRTTFRTLPITAVGQRFDGESPC